MRKKRAAFLFDSVTLSNFALTGRFDLLLLRYGRRAEITPEVFDEMLAGIVAGYFALKEVEDAANDGLITLTPPLSSPIERQTYRELLHILAPGEASCIVQGIFRGGTVVTDDRTARQCCGERNIPVTGTIGILRACCMDGTVPLHEADSILDAMIDAGYYAPVKRISDLG